MTEIEKAPPEAPVEGGFGGEENTAELGSPAKDLGSAIVVGLIALVFIVMSLRLDVPGSVFTAPGLLPLVTAGTLLIMAFVLGNKAIRAGGARGFGRAVPVALGNFFADDEGRRALLLTGIVVAYVVLVGQVSFEWRFSMPLLDLEISSYEVLSFLVVTLILKIFWRSSFWRCALISLVTVEALAAIFRYGFGIIMPEAF
jgi:hypothetical protein